MLHSQFNYHTLPVTPFKAKHVTLFFFYKTKQIRLCRKYVYVGSTLMSEARSIGSTFNSEVRLCRKTKLNHIKKSPVKASCFRVNPVIK